MVILWTIRFNYQIYWILPNECIYVFCFVLRINSHYFPILQWLIGVHNTDTVCLLRGKIEIFNKTQINLDPQRVDDTTYCQRICENIKPNITVERAELLTFGSLGFKSGPRYRPSWLGLRGVAAGLGGRREWWSHPKQQSPRDGKIDRRIII